MIKTTKVFRCGNSQAIRIPREFVVEADEMEIRKRGDVIVLRPKARAWSALVESLGRFTKGFMEDRPKQLPLERRSVPFK